MRRAGLGYVAVAVVAAVVFAPPPNTVHARSSSRGERSSLLGPVLAPSVTAADLREKENNPIPRKPLLPIWIGCLTVVALAVTRRIIFVLAASRPPTIKVGSPNGLGGRAPPAFA